MRNSKNKNRSRSSMTRSSSNRGMNSYQSIRSPRGREYTIENISAFARKHNLDSSHLSKVLRGVRLSHKNWTLI